MNGASRADPFTSAEALATLDEACQATRSAADGAELLRLGENAIFRLPDDPVVVRIAREPRRHERRRRRKSPSPPGCGTPASPLSRPTVRPQPIIARDRPVTFWKLIDDTGTKATVAELGHDPAPPARPAGARHPAAPRPRHVRPGRRTHRRRRHQRR